MIKILKSEKGTVLIVTLAIISLLLVVGFQLGRNVRNSSKVTLQTKNHFQARQLALSGLELAKAILVEDAASTTIDSVQEPWADPDLLAQAVENMGIPRDSLKITITDELSKIQINALIKEFPGNEINIEQSKIWETLLTHEFDRNEIMDQADPASIINPLKDWLDSQDDDLISGLSGAESDYYLSLENPYACANGPVMQVSELFKIKGFLSDPDEPQLFDKDTKKLEKIFTPLGLNSDPTAKGGFKYPGKININTAPVPVLEALLPLGMEGMAQDMADFRQEKTESGDQYLNPLEKGWYSAIINLSDKEKKQFNAVVQYSSQYFKIECQVNLNQTRIQLTAFVKREKDKATGNWTCQVLQVQRT